MKAFSKVKSPVTPLRGLTCFRFSLQWCGWTAAPLLTRRRMTSEGEREESDLKKRGGGRWNLRPGEVASDLCYTSGPVCVRGAPPTISGTGATLTYSSAASINRLF